MRTKRAVEVAVKPPSSRGEGGGGRGRGGWREGEGRLEGGGGEGAVRLLSSAMFMARGEGGEGRDER